MQNKTNQTATVLRPAAFAARPLSKRQTASRLQVLLKCANALFSHVEIQFKACQADYAKGALKAADYEKLRDLIYALFDVLESATWELGIQTDQAALKSAPDKHPFEAVSIAFTALAEAFESCRQADKAATLTEADIANLFMATERMQDVFYEFADDKTEVGKPDFKHRLLLLQDSTDVLGLTDTVDFMINKADAQLTMLGNAFADEDGPRLNDDTVYYALMTVKHELADIKSLVNALHLDSKKQLA